MHRHYVRVGEGGDAPRLAPEALHQPLIISVLTPEDLQGYVPVEDFIVSEVDLGHPPRAYGPLACVRSEEHTSELQSRQYLVCRLLLEKKKITDLPQHLMSHL